ncbi:MULTISPECIES: EsaB/YukD family protein [Actinomyces]|uniref:EccD-like transmembrane domain-containing protein n=1 Tax=Actinomyces respiraculi TaxID=2744574 RepID=A0A7T0PX77_9ACTO|nr:MULTISPECIES: EsaB/YukD family protein [Actinomyces]QPL05350.1 hypothetical protein ID810_11695 [Actinomyces respiraculi]
MIPYTRVTVIAPDRRAEMVLPSDEPVGLHLPALLHLLGTTSGTDLPALQLVRADASVLDPEQDLATQHVRDGEILRLMPDDDVPPPAEVSDVTGILTSVTDHHPWRWKETDRLLGTGALTLIVSAYLAHVLLGTTPGADSRSMVAIGTLGLVVLAIGAAVTRMNGLPHERALTLPGAGVLVQCVGVGLLTRPVLAWYTTDNPVAAVLAVAVALALIATGLRHEGWIAGAVLAVGFTAAWLLLEDLSLRPLMSAGLLGTSALVILGIVPWAALLVSGTSHLDDEALAGRLPRRSRVDLAVRRSHDAMAAAVLACAAATAWSTHLLIQGAGLWPMTLAVVLVIGVLLRSRAFPLRLEVLALWASALPAFAALPDSTVKVLVVAGAALAAAGLSLYRPAAHNRVRLRQLGNRLETLTVIATLPLLCGMQGLYTHLLTVFS